MKTLRAFTETLIERQTEGTGIVEDKLAWEPTADLRYLASSKFSLFSWSGFKKTQQLQQLWIAKHAGATVLKQWRNVEDEYFELTA